MRPSSAAGTLAYVSAQKIATAVVLAALAALLLSVGVPALLAPDQVPVIQITDPVTTADGDNAGVASPEPAPEQVPPARTDDDGGDDSDDEGSDDGGSPDDDGAADGSPDDDWDDDDWDDDDD